MNSRQARILLVAFAIGTLGGCGKNDAADGQSTNRKPTVRVSTVAPRQHTFTDNIEAFGVAVGDPGQTRSMSLAQGGQVIAVDVVAGQSVSAGDVLLRVATAPTARNAYAQAQSALKLARGELVRTTRLAAQHLATRSQVGQARKAVDDAQAAVKAQRDLGGASAVQAVTAPADGVVTHVKVALEDRIAADAPLLDFVPRTGLIARLGVLPDRAGQLRSGMQATLGAVYGTQHDTGEGTVRMVGAALDPRSHLLPVQVSIPVAMAAGLLPGSALDARIHVASYTAWAVPRDALRHDEKGDYLFQVVGGKAHRVDVEVRSPDGSTVGVQGALKASLPVIVMGAYELKDGMGVREGAR